MGQEPPLKQVEQMGLKVWRFVSGRVQKSKAIGSHGRQPCLHPNLLVETSRFSSKFQACTLSMV